jgi:hypothetical protein
VKILPAAVNSGSTSASGAMLIQPLREPVLLGLILVGLGTSNTATMTPAVRTILSVQGNTTPGVPLRIFEAASELVTEIRIRSGLTWDQIAALFQVSRRALHFWVSGKPISADNHDRLERLLAVIRRVDRGSPRLTSAALFDTGESGTSAYEMLRRGDYEPAVLMVAQTSRLATGARLLHTRRESQGRPAFAPEVLQPALQDRPFGVAQTVRAGRSARTKRNVGGA